MKQKKARIYYGNEENAYEPEITEYSSLEDARKNFPSQTDTEYYSEDEKGYNEVYVLAVQGDYRRAANILRGLRQEIIDLFK